MPTEPSPSHVLIAGQWRPSRSKGTFQATNPSTRETLSPLFPISSWEDCDAALDAATTAATLLRRTDPEKIAEFLEIYAEKIEAAADTIVEAAFTETGLARKPRLADVELPRTTNQLRLAATAARSGTWAMPVIDTVTGIRACYEPLGPVCVFGPNNFPFAFGSISGGDFAAALGAGNPVIAKANTSHPETTRLLAEQAFDAVKQSGLPDGTVQLIYRTEHADGARMVSDFRCGATGYTGSRGAGLALKQAADNAGKPIYLELSSVNPVVITPAALAERTEEIANQLQTSALMGSGQFCTNPGLILLIASAETYTFIAELTNRYLNAPCGTLLSPTVAKSLLASIETLTTNGAELLAGDQTEASDRCAVSNTLLKASASQFLRDPETFQTEAFGNATLLVVADSLDQATKVLESLEGNLTGCIYTANNDQDDSIYDQLAFAMIPKVGRILNDKMPTGVAVSAAMNHGGPYPATGHPGFTAVGIPASMIRFAKLTSYDNVRPNRRPRLLRDANPTDKTWRQIDGQWTQENVQS